MLYQSLRFASIIYCEVRRESPKRFPHSAASLAREANCAGGRIKEAEYAPLFRPTGYKVMREFCIDPAGFVEAVMDE